MFARIHLLQPVPVPPGLPKSVASFYLRSLLIPLIFVKPTGFALCSCAATGDADHPLHAAIHQRVVTALLPHINPKRSSTSNKNARSETLFGVETPYCIAHPGQSKREASRKSTSELCIIVLLIFFCRP